MQPRPIADTIGPFLPKRLCFICSLLYRSIDGQDTCYRLLYQGPCQRRQVEGSTEALRKSEILQSSNDFHFEIVCRSIGVRRNDGARELSYSLMADQIRR